MGYAVELQLDAEGRRRVRALRDRLAAAGHPTLTDRIGDIPHVSLAVFHDEVDVDALVELVAQWSRTTSAFRLRLASLGMFAGNTGVVFLSPLPSLRLLDEHADLHGQLGDLEKQLDGYYTPARWVPHCTVDLEVERDRIGQVASICWDGFDPFETTIESVACVRFRAVEVLATYPLGG